MLLFSLVLICCHGRSQERVQGVPEILSLCSSSIFDDIVLRVDVNSVIYDN